MALNNLPTKGKLLEVQDGTKYAYVYVPAKDSKPTFLLLHGFPSSSYDWRHQIKSLTELGFGVLTPDLLGYGDTDRPTDIHKYKFKKMAANIIDILDKESLDTVIGVAHDWGSGLLSRLVNYYPDRLSALVFISVPYIEPGSFDLDALNAMTEQAFGYPVYGYWKFFCEDDAASVYHKNNESLTSLFYPSEPAIWRTDLTPYKATVRGYNTGDDAQIPEERKFVDVPTLVVVSDQDYATRAEMAEHLAPARLRNFHIKKFEECGHWIQLEKRDELSKALVQFAEEKSGKT